MAGGGDAPNVPVWDVAILAGAVLLLSTIVIVTKTQPSSYTLDGNTQEVLTVHSGYFSGGTLTFEASCLDDPCQILTVWVVPHDGGESWNGGLADATEIQLLDSNTIETSKDLNEPLPSGDYRIILDGDGRYTFETTIQRDVPHEYVPAIIGAFLVVWGIWRKQQEDMD
jgi:hypothetical protein